MSRLEGTDDSYKADIRMVTGGIEGETLGDVGLGEYQNINTEVQPQYNVGQIVDTVFGAIREREAAGQDLFANQQERFGYYVSDYYALGIDDSSDPRLCDKVFLSADFAYLSDQPTDRQVDARNQFSNTVAIFLDRDVNTTNEVREARREELMARFDETVEEDQVPVEVTKIGEFVHKCREQMNKLWAKTKEISKSKRVKQFAAFAGAFITAKAAQWGIHELSQMDIDAPDIDIANWLSNRFNEIKMVGSYVNPLAILYGAVSRRIIDAEQNKIDSSDNKDRAALYGAAASGAGAAFLPLSIEGAVSASAGFFVADAVKGVTRAVKSRLPERTPKPTSNKGPSGKERKATVRTSNGGDGAVTTEPASGKKFAKLNLEGLI